MFALLFKVGGALFLAILMAWLLSFLRLSGIVIYSSEAFTLTLGVAAVLATFFGSLMHFAVKS